MLNALQIEEMHKYLDDGDLQQFISIFNLIPQSELYNFDYLIIEAVGQKQPHIVKFLMTQPIELSHRDDRAFKLACNEEFIEIINLFLNQPRCAHLGEDHGIIIEAYVERRSETLKTLVHNKKFRHHVERNSNFYHNQIQEHIMQEKIGAF